jgi:serine/threonine protein kinase
MDIITQIATDVTYLQKQGVFHGNLKASNVHVNHHGNHLEAMTSDFGISQTIKLTKHFDTSAHINGDHVSSTSSIYLNQSFIGMVGTTNWRVLEVSYIQMNI